MSHKSEAMETLGRENGWKTQVVTNLEEYERTGEVNDIFWTLYCLREHEHERKESLSVTWHGDLQVASSYKWGDYTLHPARKAPVLALIKGQPDPNKYTESRTQEEVYEEIKKELPFNIESSAFDILMAVIGLNVTWVRNGIERTESVPQTSNVGKSHFRVKTTSAGRRVLEWANSTGFKACYIDDIVSVS